MTGENGDQFLTTEWSQILATAGSGSASSDNEALTYLCEKYYRPVFAYFRHRAMNVAAAQDLVQGFFQSVVESKFYHRADPGKGRFRSFLLGAAKNYLLKEGRSQLAAKRGGGAQHLSLNHEDTKELEDTELQENGEHLFDHEWAVTVFEKTWEILRAEYEQTGNQERFEKLRPCVMEMRPENERGKLAQELGLSNGGFRTALHRLKSRFREVFRALVAESVENPAEVDDEVSYLIRASVPVSA